MCSLSLLMQDLWLCYQSIDRFWQILKTYVETYRKHHDISSWFHDFIEISMQAQKRSQKNGTCSLSGSRHTLPAVGECRGLTNKKRTIRFDAWNLVTLVMKFSYFM
jgi:hypothetical protein